jgi:predicted dehydrogenase
VHCQYTFLKAVAEGRHPDPSLRQGIRVQRIMDSAEKSVKTGAWQEVPAGT